MAATGSKRDGETALLRELILEHASQWVPRTRRELQRRVEDDFGPVGDRRMLRQIAVLIRSGLLKLEIQDDEGDLPVPVYRLVKRSASVVGLTPRHCKICGLIGGKTTGHPNHTAWNRRDPERKRAYWTPPPAPDTTIRNPVARLKAGRAA